MKKFAINSQLKISESLDFLKSLLKYSATVFVLLLIGYSQLFTLRYDVNTPYAVTKNIKQSEHAQVMIVKTTESDSIIFEEEEEDDRICLKKYSYIISAFPFPHALESFVQQNIRYSCFSKYFSSFVSFISPYIELRVLRL